MCILALLEFIYCDEIELNEKLALDLFKLCDKYSLADLKGICEKFLSKCITLDNFVEVINVAEKFGGSELQDKAIEYGIEHLEVLEEKGSLYEISSRMLVKLACRTKKKVSK